MNQANGNTKKGTRKHTQKKEGQKTANEAMSVGAVAERSGVTVPTLHFYEEKGLITSWRNNGNQRRYNKEVLRRIVIIKTAQKLGFSLEEIRQAMSVLPVNKAPGKSDWQKLSQAWQQELDSRIASMTRLRNEMDQCIGCGCLSLDYCPIRNPDDYLASQGQGAVSWLNKAPVQSGQKDG